MNLLNTIWRTLYPCLYLLALLLLGWYAFKYNDQGLDFFIGIITENLFPEYIIKSCAFLVIWCLIVWYAARIVLQVKPIDVEENRLSLFLQVWIPRVLGIMPILIVIDAMMRAAKSVDNELTSTLVTNIAVLIALAALLILFFVNRAKLARTMGVRFAHAHQRYSRNAIPFRHLWQSRANRIAFISIAVTIALIVLPFFFFLKNGYARSLQPAPVLLCGFIFFTIAFSAIVIAFNFRKSPAFLLIIGYLLLLSTCNNNNAIRVIEGSPLKERPTIRDNFDAWIAKRVNTTDSVIPLYIIAAEGGGIRAANWTAIALKKIEEKHPEILDHVYAISGVSGGGVGAAFYAGYRSDMLSGKLASVNNASARLDSAVGEDFLSDLTAAFIFHDNLQRILPFPVENFSRNRKLEDSWGWSYESFLGSSTMSDPFLSLWKNKDSLRVPNLFINGLLAETGQKAIVSNLQLSDSIFRDDIDVLGVLGKDMPLKTAASLCARFPVITSGALLKEDGKPRGHILDGGYKENSGIETAWQLAIALSHLIAEAELAHNKKIETTILFIRNSNKGISIRDDDFETTKVLPDLTTILPGFLNAWDRRTETHVNISKELFNEGALKNKYRYLEITLDNRNKLLPLGWYLSENAKKIIQSQSKNIVLPAKR